MVDLKMYGYTPLDDIPNGLIPGRVTELRRERFTVITEQGEVKAVLKGTFYYSAEASVDFPCVGDFVLLLYNNNGDSLIDKVLPRRTKFSRADYLGHSAGFAKTIKEQVVATNFDYVFIISSLNGDFNVSRIMRYLTLAKQTGAQPVVLLTKADLAENYNHQLIEISSTIPDIPVHAISSFTGLGLEELNAYLIPGKSVVFMGMSGVGKSSLLNVLVGEDVMKVQEIREMDSRGRHTTTHRQLFMLPSGTMVIDTPGMRELGLFNAEQGISSNFADIEELVLQCRFTNCSHHVEPGCAILAALDDGSLHRERWKHYNNQRNENKFVQDKSGYMIEKRARNKSIAMWSKHNKKNGGWR